MANPWSSAMFREPTLSSDENGNQVTPSNWTKMGWGVDPTAPGYGSSLGSFQQPTQGFNPSINWNAPTGSFGVQQIPTLWSQKPQQPGFGPRNQAWSPPASPSTQPNSFGSFNPQAPNPSWAQPTPKKFGSNTPQSIQGQGYNQMRNQLAPTPQTQQSKGYAQMRAEANMTPQQKQNQAYGQMRNAASGPNPKNGAFFQAAKNPLVLQAQAAAQKAFWSNAYTQLNAALRGVDLSGTPKASGGGYGYGGYGYGYGGGGGYSRPKYAENLPGAVWRMNQ